MTDKQQLREDLEYQVVHDKDGKLCEVAVLLPQPDGAEDSQPE